MSERVSRRKIAAVIAERIAKNEPIAGLMREAAAYLIETNRIREYELLVRDIEDALATRGIVIADVTAAAKLPSDVSAALKQFAPQAKKVVVREHIDESVVGGVRVELPGERFDGTLQHKIARLRALKV